MSPKLVHLIAAARPNFMKVAPLYHAFAQAEWCAPRIVHTGQHYDASMSEAFFRDLRLPEPAHHLGVGSGTHAEQTGRPLIEYGAGREAGPPESRLVVGDLKCTAALAPVGGGPVWAGAGAGPRLRREAVVQRGHLHEVRPCRGDEMDELRAHARQSPE